MTKITETASEQYIFSNRNEPETVRLNRQHRIAVRNCNGRLIHPVIPTEAIQTIADVATGTGIWLEEIPDQLPNKATRLDGFDISPAQFPLEDRRVGKYILQDVMKPFPAEYHDLYDLVHVKYLTAALKPEEFSTALKNMLQITKPGGYIQWEELDLDSVGIPGASETSSSFQMMRVLQNFFHHRGMCTRASPVVKAAFQEASLQDIYHEIRNSYWIGDMDEDLVEWGTESCRDVFAPALLIAGKVKNMEEALEMKPVLFAEVQKEWEKCPPNMAHGIVVGRKAV